MIYSAPAREVLATSATVPQWISAIAAIVSAVGGTAGFAALWITVKRHEKASKVPPAEFRRLLHELEDLINDVIANGGRPAAWFLTSERRRTTQMLASYGGLLVDDELNDLVGQARIATDDCWVLAPSALPDADRPLPPQELERVNRQLEQQRERAGTGRVALTKAIDRLNALTREAGPSS